LKLPDLLANALTRAPGRACVVTDHRQLTFAEVDERAGRLASALSQIGARAGDRVALLALNEPEYFEIQIAAQRAGVMLVPLNHRLAVAELRAILADCAPSVLIHGPQFADAAAALEVPAALALGPAYEAALDAADPCATSPLDADMPCSILYTSGTTGRAKGAVISNGCLWARVNQFCIELGIHDGDSSLFPIPMFHTSSSVPYAFMYLGCTVVLPQQFDPARAIELMARYRTTHAVYVPTMLARVVEELEAAPVQLDALRVIQYGGSPIAPGMLRRALRALGCAFIQGYGLTEAINATVLRRSEHDPDGRPELLTSAGRDTISYETRIVDRDERELGPGEIGEIVIRGPGVMEGYWRAPQDTERALRGGWLHTGDLGYRSAEGYLFITDRLKDVIVSGGENVYSREVEDALHDHPGVREAAVIGIPSAQWGESVHAELVAVPGVALDPDEVISFCRTRLAGYKTPKSLTIVDELPKNAAGKILKRAVRQPYWEGAQRSVG
jgi:acyl-CoA synthetase (AMP-forming)/AMP-acid ligase II